MMMSRNNSNVDSHVNNNGDDKGKRRLAVVHQELFPVFSTAWALGATTFGTAKAVGGTVMGLYSAVRKTNEFYNFAARWLGGTSPVTAPPTAQAADIGDHLGGGGDGGALFQKSALLTMGSYVAYNIGKYAVDQFIAQNGQYSRERMEDIVKEGWVKINGNGGGHAADNNNNTTAATKIERSMDNMKTAGKMEEAQYMDAISNFPQNNRILMGIMFTMLTFLIHYSGAHEMRRQIRKDREKKGGFVSATTKSGTTVCINDDEADLWKQIDPLSTKSKTISRGSNQLFLRTRIRSLYENSDFYSGVTQSSIFSTNPNYLSDCDPARVIFNILLGASIQLNRFIGFHSSRGDATLLFSQWVSIAMYWEIIAHLLKLHGWAPMYTALVKISQILVGYEGNNGRSSSATTTNKSINKVGKRPPRR